MSIQCSVFRTWGGAAARHIRGSTSYAEPLNDRGLTSILRFSPYASLSVP